MNDYSNCVAFEENCTICFLNDLTVFKPFATTNLMLADTPFLRSSCHLSVCIAACMVIHLFLSNTHLLLWLVSSACKWAFRRRIRMHRGNSTDMSVLKVVL